MAEGEAPVDDRGANVYSDLFTGARPVLPYLQRTAHCLPIITPLMMTMPDRRQSWRRC